MSTRVPLIACVAFLCIVSWACKKPPDKMAADVKPTPVTTQSIKPSEMAQSPEAAYQMVQDGLEAKLLGLDKFKEYHQGSTAHRPKAKGFEVVRLQVEVRPSGPYREIKLATTDQELIDSDGRRYTGAIDFKFSEWVGKPMRIEILFAAPRNANLKTFRLGSASFEISSLIAAKNAVQDENRKSRKEKEKAVRNP